MLFVDEMGITRYMGNRVPAANATRANWTVYGEVPQAPLVPRDKWPGLIAQFDPDSPAHPHRPPVRDQNGVGQCNADATVALHEYTRNAMGLQYVQLSGADLYDRINGGGDNGSLLEDAIREMMDAGVGTAETCGLLWKRGYYKGPAPAAERARYKVAEAYLCPTFDHLMSAVLCGFGIVSGIPWYDNYTPDKAGWLPSPRGNSGGHAVFGYKPTMRVSGDTTTYGIWHQNSWTTQFGVGGAVVFPESVYHSGAIGGWWATRQVTDEGTPIPAPHFQLAI